MDNIFHLKIFDGFRLNVIFKTEERKLQEEKSEFLDDRFLPVGLRGIENDYESIASRNEQIYKQGSYGLSDSKVKNCVDTLWNHPILTERFLENGMVKKLLSDQNAKDEIFLKIGYLKNLQQDNPELDEILKGKNPAGLKESIEFLKSSKNLKRLEYKKKTQQKKLTELLDHIIEPEKFVNPRIKNSNLYEDIIINEDFDNFMAQQNEMNEEKSQSSSRILGREGRVYLPHSVGPELQQDSTRQQEDSDDLTQQLSHTLNLAPGQNSSSVSRNFDPDEPVCSQQDPYMRQCYHKYQKQYLQMKKEMGMENESRILYCLDSAKGNLLTAIDTYYSFGN